ncbi:hypothetical protein D915_000597 [Fasciola hepatica]|uniref:Uncharacterized protein n=1 Tax=Fasciola hepatica TaxID=6192 RepID=A0A4E0S428_FASHE|nr:hypothetical protein D915_000597 [Fasciola hepatica]
MSLAETKHPMKMSITKSLPLSVVSNLYYYTPTGAGGCASPSQLYSPAPVRSGKTPMSPVAPLDSQCAFATEFSDDDVDDVFDENMGKYPGHMTSDKNRAHSIYNFLYKQLGTRDLITGRINSTGNTNTKPMIVQSSLISPLNLSVSVQSKQPQLVSSMTADHLHDSSLSSQTIGKFGTDSLIAKSHSLLDFDTRMDEEFTFRMQAEPFSLARDAVATSGLCVGVVCDEHDSLAPMECEMRSTAEILESVPSDQSFPTNCSVDPCVNGENHQTGRLCAD